MCFLSSVLIHLHFSPSLSSPFPSRLGRRTHWHCSFSPLVSLSQWSRNGLVTHESIFNTIIIISLIRFVWSSSIGKTIACERKMRPALSGISAKLCLIHTHALLRFLYPSYYHLLYLIIDTRISCISPPYLRYFQSRCASGVDKLSLLAFEDVIGAGCPSSSIISWGGRLRNSSERHESHSLLEWWSGMIYIKSVIRGIQTFNLFFISNDLSLIR